MIKWIFLKCIDNCIVERSLISCMSLIKCIKMNEKWKAVRVILICLWTYALAKFEVFHIKLRTELTFCRLFDHISVIHQNRVQISDEKSNAFSVLPLDSGKCNNSSKSQESNSTWIHRVMSDRGYFNIKLGWNVDHLNRYSKWLIEAGNSQKDRKSPIKYVLDVMFEWHFSTQSRTSWQQNILRRT